MLYTRKQVCLGTIMLLGSIFGLIVRRVAAEQYTCFLFFVHGAFSLCWSAPDFVSLAFAPVVGLTARQASGSFLFPPDGGIFCSSPRPGAAILRIS